MEKIIKQLAIVGVAGAMTLSLGCDLEVVEDLNQPSTGFAPPSLDGKIGVTTITSGTGDAANTGSTTITFSSSTYSEVGDGVNTGNDSGTYTYTKTGPNTATAVMNSVDSDSITASLTFTSPTSGSFSAVQTIGTHGTQDGSFIFN